MGCLAKSELDRDRLVAGLQATEANRIVLFGAGGYGEDLLAELKNVGATLPVCFADNDPTKQGRSLQGLDIVDPDQTDPAHDLVVIATISAGDQVSAQLETLGFERNVSYLEVIQRLDFDHAFNAAAFYRNHGADFVGKRILHVGPGGNLCVELLLSALGAAVVYTVEYNAFRIQYPEVTAVRALYDGLASAAQERLNVDISTEGALLENGDRLEIDTRKIGLLYPCSITALPFANDTFDLVLHHTVFEHVSNPQAGYREIYRVLKPGGATIGLVDPQDHRTFSSSNDFHPLKFLEYSRSDWYAISQRINFHNQVTTPEHRSMISVAGFDIDVWEPLMTMPVPPEMYAQFHPDFQCFNPDELGVLRFAVKASKPTVAASTR